MSREPNWLHKITFRFQWQALPVTEEIFSNWNIVLLREKKEAKISKLNVPEIQREDQVEMVIQTILCVYVSICICVCACLCGEGCYSTNNISYNSNIPCQKMSVHKVLNFCHVTNVFFTDQDYKILWGHNFEKLPHKPNFQIFPCLEFEMLKAT